MGSNFVRLSELEGSTLADALPVFEVPEHIAIGDHLAVDVNRLGNIATWAGFERGVSLHGYSGEATKTNVSVVGGSDEGTAYAGGATSKQAQLGQAEFSDRSTFRVRTPLDLSINITPVEQQIAESGKPVRDPANWAGPIDHAVRSTLRDAAWNHLVTGELPRDELVEYSLILANAAFNISTDLFHTRQRVVEMYRAWTELLGPAGVVAFGVSVVALSSVVSGALKSVLYKNDGPHIFSFVPMFPVDRAAVVSAKTRLPGSLVKAIK